MTKQTGRGDVARGSTQRKNAQGTATREPGGRGEQAVLVAVEFTGERRKLTTAIRLARSAAALQATSDEEDGLVTEGAGSRAGDADVEAGIAEFEELARSAGAVVAATIRQRRARPDAATLVGGGKLEEIEGVVASTGAGWCCSTTI